MGEILEFRPKPKEENDAEFVARVTPDMMAVIGFMRAACGECERFAALTAVPIDQIEDQDGVIKALDSLIALSDSATRVMTPEFVENVSAVERIANLGILGRAEAGMLVDAFTAAALRFAEVMSRFTGKAIDLGVEGC